MITVPGCSGGALGSDTGAAMPESVNDWESRMRHDSACAVELSISGCLVQQAVAPASVPCSALDSILSLSRHDNASVGDTIGGFGLGLESPKLHDSASPRDT